MLAEDYSTACSMSAEPHCGEDFCDDCGDCLACHWEDGCRGRGDVEHAWAVYAYDVGAWMKQHPEAREVGT